jgi:tetratricopeptide (TPR) repeat protein
LRFFFKLVPYLLVLLPAAHAEEALLQTAMRQSATAYVRGEYRDAAKLLEAVVSDGATAARVPRVQHSAAIGSLAGLYLLEGRYVEAEGLLRRTLVSSKEVLGADPLAAARQLVRLGEVLSAQGRYAEAEAEFQNAIALLQPGYGLDHAYVADCLNSLADLSRLQGHYDEAERRYWRAYMIRSYLYGAESSAVGETLAGLGTLFAQRRRDAEARALFARSLSIEEKPARRDNAWGRLDERDLRELIPAERETEAVRGKMFTRQGSPRDLEHAQHFERLAALYAAQGRYADAEHTYRRAVSIRQRAFGAEHPLVLQSLTAIASIRRNLGDSSKALDELRGTTAALARRISAHGTERSEYGRGERRRWRASFMLQLSLLTQASGTSIAPAAAAEAFVALQYAQIAAGGERALEDGEVRRQLGTDEALVAAAAGDGEVYVTIVRRDSTELRRYDGGLGEAAQGIRERLSGVRRAYLVSDSAEAIAGFTRLPSVGSLRR